VASASYNYHPTIESEKFLAAADREIIPIVLDETMNDPSIEQKERI
jgi:hypothetical protein